jgi:serine/threonine-protein kinase RsbW
MPSGAVKLTIESRFENAALVGVAVNRICREAGFSEQGAFEVELCVVEAVNNSIEHAYREEPGKEVVVELELNAQGLKVTVADTGRSLPAKMLPSVRAAPDQRARLADGGRGLFIIRSMMDQVGYESASGKNVLSMSKKLVGPGHPERQSKN